MVAYIDETVTIRANWTYCESSLVLQMMTLTLMTLTLMTRPVMPVLWRYQSSFVSAAQQSD